MEALLVINPTVPLGQVVATRGVFALAGENPKFAEFMRGSLNRHAKGDWGDLDEADRQENELSLKQGFRILSAYKTDDLPKIWIITEADKSVTTILFPEEY
ncbi:hypothetical protein DEALK_00440 [Dehalogenimonas alkenigignens]|uniref:Plasmid related protein n=1 Tax=Dehalogenimonas alkenigignens TaxID=1217799 RepID=A0A0W0GKQ3_9CHLR|nr:hypothetical protein [Dehalogenimonas alkenigignens]KTB49132.1 hypothetical protein DEALK_00440 [Dehalogenimonas alkenigignens]